MEKICYEVEDERRVYESVDDGRLSLATSISEFNGEKVTGSNGLYRNVLKTSNQAV